MPISKDNLLDCIADTSSLVTLTYDNLESGCSMSQLFTNIEEIEEQLRKLRELTVQHSKEIAQATGSVPGVRLSGKPDRRYKAAKRKYS